MKNMARRALFALLLPCLPSPALAVRGVHHEGPAGPSKQAAGATKQGESHPLDGALRAAGPAPVMVVEKVVPVPVVVEEVVPVPVVEVVVAGDREEAEPGADDDAAAPHIDGACKRGLLALTMSAARMARVQACERHAGYTDQAIKALQRANSSAALAAVEGVYHKCMNLSQDCAGQIAPHLVNKMRLSGMAITEKCKTVANEVAPNTSTAAQACHRNMTTAMVAELKQRNNLDGAMAAAQHGLQACDHIEPPCDFQLAPGVLVQLLQAVMAPAQQTPMSQVLLAGIRQAEQLAAQMEAQEEEEEALGRKATPPKQQAKGDASTVASHDAQKGKPATPKQRTKHDAPAAAAQKKHAAVRRLSLLSVDERVRLSFQHRAVQL